MEKIFDSVKELDRRAEDTFDLKNGVLMEQAARGMAEHIRNYLVSRQAERAEDSTLPYVQIVCGSGDNGGDGYALVRMLTDFCTVRVIAVKEPKSVLCKLQRERLRLLGIPVYTEVEERCDVLVDALFGTGIRGALDGQMCALIERLNTVSGYKIACDVPSGLNEFGVPSPIAFHADKTCTMGALKTALFADTAKDYTGSISLCNLGLPRSRYEGDTDTFLLSAADMRLPRRTVQNTHKMSYGHGLFFCGEKAGACVLAASAALHFGIGLVTVFGSPIPHAPFDFMYASQLPETFSAVMLGSGLGSNFELQTQALKLLAHEQVREKPLILDAGILYNAELPALLPHLKQPILTPHPKEFQSLLAQSGLAQASVAEIQERRFVHLRMFCKAFPHAVTVLKGAYPLIGCGNRMFVNPFGSNALAKAGTGDVLSGMITALTAQGYPPLEAAYTASLAHAEAAKRLRTDYGVTASELAVRIAEL